MSTMTSGVRAEINDQRKSSFTLLNVGDDPVLEAQYSGIFYRFPKGENVAIEDRFKWQKVKKHGGLVEGRLLLDQPKVPDCDKEGQGSQADYIAQELMDENRLGNRGLCIQTGDEVKDAERRRTARATFIATSVAWARERQAEWLTKCQLSSQDPGSLPPVMSSTVKKAMAILEKYGNNPDQEVRLRWICKLDGWEDDNRDNVVKHIRDFFPLMQDQDPNQFILDRDQVYRAASATDVENIRRAVPPAEAPRPAAVESQGAVATEKPRHVEIVEPGESHGRAPSLGSLDATESGSSVASLIVKQARELECVSKLDRTLMLGLAEGDLEAIEKAKAILIEARKAKEEKEA